MPYLSKRKGERFSVAWIKYAYPDKKENPNDPRAEYRGYNQEEMINLLKEKRKNTSGIC